MENSSQFHIVHIEPMGVKCKVPHGTFLGSILGQYGADFPCSGRGVCGNCRIELLKGNIDLTAWQKKLLEKKGYSTDNWRLACLSSVTEDITIRIPQGKHQILTDQSQIKEGKENGYAIAVDLGSTTVVAQLINLENGEIISSAAELNTQSQYGADIMSRISFAIQGDEQLTILSSLIREQIGKQIKSLTSSSQINDIRRVVLVGNSVMHHLFCHLDVTPLATYPFQSKENAAQNFTPEEVNWDLPSTCQITFLPNMSHFVGSDILAGLKTIEIHKQEKWHALIDLGTNGEMVIGKKGKILCTSTAAGPAFEGVNISKGMRAVSGAICAVDENNGQVQVVDQAEPVGICGSGLIDAIHYLTKQEIIDMSGAIADESLTDKLTLAPNVALLEQDIREFQLAKAAIATGFQLLMKELSITIEDIETIHVSGGLGTYLNINNAMEIGLLQGKNIEQIHKAGNTALIGCKKFLYQANQKDIDEILSITEHFGLESSPDFQDYYCNNLFFGNIFL